MDSIEQQKISKSVESILIGLENKYSTREKAQEQIIHLVKMIAIQQFNKGKANARAISNEILQDLHPNIEQGHL